MAYTYLLGWSDHNKFYYGVRYSKKCIPEELGVTYMSSSKYVKQFISSYGTPDIIQVRKIFNNKEDAIIWEHKVLRRLKAPFSDKWINRTDNKAINGDQKAYSNASKLKWKNEVYRSKKVESMKNKWQDKDWASNRNLKAKTTWQIKKDTGCMPILKRTDAQKERYRQAALKRWQSAEYRKKQSNSIIESWKKRDAPVKDVLTGKFITLA